MPLTFPFSPGFSDVPDAVYAAEAYAYGINLGKLAENAAFGMVRPELFMALYKHGDTVELPTSAIDAYAYSRDELVYSWGIHSTANPADNWISFSGNLWYAQWFVEQNGQGPNPGLVTCDEVYWNNSDKKSGSTNDGILIVYTWAIRRKNTLFIATTPSYLDVADADFAIDSALHTTALTELSHNCKSAVVSSEVFYMGNYINGQTVSNGAGGAFPISPDDSYHYSQAETIFFYSWVWTAYGATFEPPTIQTPIIGNVLTQLERLEANVAANGAVSIDVQFYNSGVIDTTVFGRIAVFALCTRTLGPISGSTFGWVDPVDLESDNPDRTDLMVQINENARYANLRPEFFDAGTFTNGQTVPLPVSPRDGYTYSRDECSYMYELADTDTGRVSPDIRIVIWNINVDQLTGHVSISLGRLRTGQSYHATTNGSIRVKTVALRDHPANTKALTSTISEGDVGFTQVSGENGVTATNDGEGNITVSGPLPIYNRTIYVPARPLPGQTIFHERQEARISITYDVNFINSTADALDAAALDATFTIYKNKTAVSAGTAVATITFSSGTYQGIFSSSAAITWAPGERLSILAPATQDGALGRIGIVLAGSRTDVATTIAASSAPSVMTTAAPDGTSGTAYSYQLVATGGLPPYSWDITTGALPAGTSLNTSTGVISGTPTSTGSSTFTVTATDANGGTSSQQVTITVVGTGALSFDTASIPDAIDGQPYSFQLQASGGVPPYTWSTTSPLPTGLTLNPTTGVISGTPATGSTAPVSFAESITVTDSA